MIEKWVNFKRDYLKISFLRENCGYDGSDERRRNVPPRFWGWMIIHLYNDPVYMVCDVVDPFSFFFLLVRKVCHVGWVPLLCV